MKQSKEYRSINLKDKYYVMRLALMSFFVVAVVLISNVTKIEGEVGSILGMAIFWTMVVVLINTIRYEEKHKYWFLSIPIFLGVLFTLILLGVFFI